MMEYPIQPYNYKPKKAQGKIIFFVILGIMIVLGFVYAQPIKNYIQEKTSINESLYIINIDKYPCSQLEAEGRTMFGLNKDDTFNAECNSICIQRGKNNYKYECKQDKFYCYCLK